MSAAALDAVAAAASETGLDLVGAFHPASDDAAPEGCGTLALLGPDGRGFWPVFEASPEAADGGPDPMDRWSRRVIGRLAARFGAAALFPFDGPPYAPFFRWAQRAGTAWPSPLGMLVHARRGLWISYRGALALREKLDPPSEAPARPCAPCPAPCRSACPVGAFGAAGYDVAACLAHLAAPEGAACRETGCLARRACPVGRALAPPPAQAAYHIAAFRDASDKTNS